MTKIKQLIKTIKDYLYDHHTLKVILEYFVTFLGATISAFLFAYGFKSFISPSVMVDGKQIGSLVTGGASGISQIIVKIIELCGADTSQIAFGTTRWSYLLQSGFYFIINVPILVLSFLKIGKKFTFFTLVNVGMYFLIVNILPESFTNMFYSQGDSYGLSTDFLARSLFAGICTGVSTATALIFRHSAGGIDALSVYVNEKYNGKSIGRISMTINVFIILIYTTLSVIKADDMSLATCALYTLVYFFTSSTIVDTIFIRNKKMQLQIITDNADLSDVIIHYFPHSCTVLRGQGGYSKNEKVVIYTVLSRGEYKRALQVIKDVDPKAFITVTNVNQVVGRFYVAPRE